METQCSQHGKPFTVACLEAGCQQPFLCLVCYRTHNENHTEFINILEGDTKWVKPYETELAQLAKHPLLATPPVQHDVLAHNKEVINQMIENLVRKIKDKGNSLIEKMTEQMKEQQAIEKFSQCLKEKNETLQNINFTNGDTFQLVKEVKRFREELSPNIQEALKLMSEDLAKWKLNPIKVLQAEKLLQKVILENINTEDLFSGLEAGQLEAMSPSLKESLESQKKLQKEIDDLKESLKATDVAGNNVKSEINGLEEKLKAKNKEIEGLKSLYKSETEFHYQTQSQLDAVLSIPGDICCPVYDIGLTSQTVIFCKGFHNKNSKCPIYADRPCFRTVNVKNLFSSPFPQQNSFNYY